ncbi:MAG TPA: mechanosensitive ion channel [Candidatus Ozemobacteraceae bacterium]|nr:mechanosensitive ion channel [Candidatus Ozemobacteraceae bacterium]
MDNATKMISALYSFWDTHFGSVQLTSLGAGFDHSMIATLVFLVILLPLLALFRRLRRHAAELGERPGFSIGVGELTLVSPAELSGVLQGVIRLLRIAALVFLFFCWAALITGFFPATRGLATASLRWLFSGAAGVGRTILSWLPGLATILFILFLTFQAMKLVSVIMQAVERGRVSIPGFHAEWAGPTDKLARFFLLALGIVLGAPFLPGFDSPAFQGVTVFLGVLLSLGSTAAVANVVAGVALIYMRACHPGDRVRIGDTEGIVMETGLLVTRIRTQDNQVITLPNGLVLSQPVINLSALANEEGAGISVELTLAYDIDWRQVHELLLAAANGTEGVIREPAPFVLQRGFSDIAALYRLQAYTRDATNLPRTHSTLRANILDAFNKAGVEILCPAYESSRDGTPPIIPPARRPA